MILKLVPILKPAIWGGDKLLPYKHISPITIYNDPIGESWEVSGLEDHSSVIEGGPFDGCILSELIKTDTERFLGKNVSSRFGDKFPLLLKFIDTSKELSIQVHPDDNLAKARHNSNGKAEIWLVLGTEEGAFLRSGFKRKITPEEYDAAVASNDICSLLQEYRTAPGDVFFIPPGCIHNIGAGTFLLELQQSSDITYRIYDFDRRDSNGLKRQLHTDMAKDAIDFNVNDKINSFHIDLDSESRTNIIHNEYFSLDMFLITEHTHLEDVRKDEFFILTNISGSGRLVSGTESVTLRSGESVLITADTDSLEIIPDNNSGMRILKSYI